MIVSQDTKNLIYDKLNLLQSKARSISFEENDIVKIGEQRVSIENLEEVFYQKWLVFKEISKNKLEMLEEQFDEISKEKFMQELQKEI